MPITPLHIGIPGLISYYFPKRVDISAAVIGCIIIDIDLPEYGVIDSIKDICSKLPNIKIIALTHSETEKDFFCTMRAGARAYISKLSSLKDLLKAIALVAEGGIYISPPMAERLLSRFSSIDDLKEKARSSASITLTRRERSILSLVSQGLTNREIATKLYISEHTVKAHMKNIMEKLHAHTRQEAVTLAEEQEMRTWITKS